jgi:hypothetical protein
MATVQMIKRIFRSFGKEGENKEYIYVEILSKDGEDTLAACLPKAQIKILNREYGWGGRKSVEIEFPSSLCSLFKSIEPIKNIQYDGNECSFTLHGKNFQSTVDTMESLKKIELEEIRKEIRQKLCKP